MRFRYAVALSLLVCAPPAAGQTAGDLRAAVALSASHIGALTPLMTPSMTGRRVGSGQLALRYGLRDDDGLLSHAVAVSGMFEVGTNSSLTLTAGLSDDECAGCSPSLMLGLGGDMRVFDAGDVASGATFHVSVNGDLGFAQLEPGNNSAFAFAVGAPVTMSLTTDAESGMRLVPYLTPAFGIGQVDGACPLVGTCERSGTRFLLGGGVGLWNPTTRISASLGVNQVLIEGGKAVYGVNVVVR